jgi:ubiquinone/menaquinone biosynthesis C-methylase UbiE
MPDRDAAYFAAWYADMGHVPDKDRLWTTVLGLPPHVLSTSALTGAALDEVAGILGLCPGDVLLDLACGRAGYGLELAARSGARLLALDFAEPAIVQARRNARTLGLDDRADLRVGDMTATGLPPASVSAVLCVDAAQFPADFRATFAEAHRVLVPGGVAVFTGWEARVPEDPAASERIRRVDLAAGLRSAGFTQVEVRSREDWLAAEQAAWRAEVALPASEDPATRSLQAEGRRSIERGDVYRRVLGVGRRAVRDDLRKPRP